jgi:hypothetical protein
MSGVAKWIVGGIANQGGPGARITSTPSLTAPRSRRRQVKSRPDRNALSIAEKGEHEEKKDHLDREQTLGCTIMALCYQSIRTCF